MGGKIKRRCNHRVLSSEARPSCSGNGSSGSGSSASRKPMKIQGAISLYSLRSLSKDDEIKKMSSNRVGTNRLKMLNRESSFDYDNSLALPETNEEEIRYNCEAEDSDGLWGVDEDDGEQPV